MIDYPYSDEEVVEQLKRFKPIGARWVNPADGRMMEMIFGSTSPPRVIDGIEIAEGVTLTMEDDG